MVEDVVLKPIQPHRLRVRDKVHAMPAFCELMSEFCGQDSATAIGWVADHSNAHIYLCIRCPFNPTIR
jgi:hypothetical protein